MAIVSDIEIRLRADIARLQQDMDRARQQVGGAMSSITQMAKKAGAALAAIGVGMAVGALAGFVKAAIDTTDAISDISQRTGVAIKDIAGLQLWFQIGGAEAGEFEGAMIKLAKNIASGSDEFKRIGVATRNADGSLRSNIEVLGDSADAFQKLQDGSAKTALAIDIFGKSGATLLPILNSGSEGLREMTEMADKLGLTFDQNTVDAAGAFNDTLDFLGLAAQGVGRQLAAQLLPALNAVAGSFLEFVVKGDGVKKMAEGISAVLKTLYTVGVTVYTVFKTLGNTLAAAAAQVVAVMTGDFKAAASIGQIWKDEVAADFTSAAKTITDVWNNAGGETVAALAGVQKKSATVADKASKDAEKQADAYKSMLRTLEDRVESTARELAGLLPLNEAEKAHLDLTRQIADGKVKLTVAERLRAESLINEAGANEVLAKSNKEFEDIQKQLIKNTGELAAERYSLIDSAKQEAEQNELAVKTFGMAESAIIRLNAARLMEQETQRLGRSLTEDEIADLNRVIALKERSAKAVAAREELEAAKTFWTDIEKTAHETFVSIADGGKSAFKRLKDTAKNTFFDWLYQMTLKKWIINIGTTMSGVGGVSGIANAATSAAGGGVGEAFSLASSAKSIYSTLTGGATLAGGLGTGFLGSLAGGLNGAGIGSGLTSAIGLNIGNSIAGVVGSNVASGIATGLSGLAAAAPWVAGALAVYTIGKKAFGRGPKEYTGEQTLSGSLGGGGFSGMLEADWKKKGGWFSSSKYGKDSSPVDAAVSQSLGEAYNAIQTSSADFARVLGANADSIMSRSQTIRIAMGKDEAANQKAIADFFVGVADTIAHEIIPSIDQFRIEGEAAATTLQRVTTNFAGIDVVLEQMGLTSQKAFGAVGIESIAARERLIAFAGGLESLAAQTAYFNDNFLSQAQRLGPLQKQVNDRLAELGYAGVKTAEQFRQSIQGLIDGGALATQSGTYVYTSLLALAPAFKNVADYLDELNEAARQTLRDRAGTAIDALSRAVDTQKDQVSKAFTEMMSSLETGIDGANDAIERTSDLSRTLRESRIRVESDSQLAASRQSAQAQIASAIAIARASGVLPSTDDLRDALSTLNQDASGQFSSLVDYQREVARTNNQLSELGGLTDEQLGIAERQLKALQDQQTAVQTANERELTRLDGLVSAAQSELTAIENGRIATLSVAEAVYRVDATLRELDYNVNGSSYAEPPVFYAPPTQASTMQSNEAMLTEMRMMNSRLASSEASNQVTAQSIQQLASQFNQVSGGGNTLIVEQAQ